MLSKFSTIGDEISYIFFDSKKTIVYPNIFYKANYFIQHGAERVNFSERFRELIDKTFAFNIPNFEIFCSIYFNQLKIVSDFNIFNFFLDKKNDQSFKYLEKTFFNIYCLHLKLLIVSINSIFSPNKIH